MTRLLLNYIHWSSNILKQKPVVRSLRLKMYAIFAYRVKTTWKKLILNSKVMKKPSKSTERWTKYAGGEKKFCLKCDFRELALHFKFLHSSILDFRGFNIINVHVFGSHQRSHVYFFTEGNLKEGANTVCNFPLEAILRESKLECYNKICLFSDGCDDQNKNYSFVSEKENGIFPYSLFFSLFFSIFLSFY